MLFFINLPNPKVFWHSSPFFAVRALLYNRSGLIIPFYKQMSNVASRVVSLFTWIVKSPQP